VGRKGGSNEEGVLYLPALWFHEVTQTCPTIAGKEGGTEGGREGGGEGGRALHPLDVWVKRGRCCICLRCGFMK